MSVTCFETGNSFFVDDENFAVALPGSFDEFLGLSAEIIDAVPEEVRRSHTCHGWKDGLNIYHLEVVNPSPELTPNIPGKVQLGGARMGTFAFSLSQEDAACYLPKAMSFYNTCT